MRATNAMSTSQGKRKVVDTFPKRAEPKTDYKPKQKKNVKLVKNEVYACLKDGLHSGLYYLNLKPFEKFEGTDAQAHEAAAKITEEMQILGCTWMPGSTQQGRDGKEFFMHGMFKCQFKTPVGLDICKEAFTLVTGLQLETTKYAETVQTPTLTAEARAGNLAIMGDSRDLDNWLNGNGLGGQWVSAEKAFMVYCSDDEEDEEMPTLDTAYINLGNVLRYLGWHLTTDRDWSRARRPVTRSMAPIHLPACRTCALYTELDPTLKLPRKLPRQLHRGQVLHLFKSMGANPDEMRDERVRLICDVRYFRTWSRSDWVCPF